MCVEGDAAAAAVLFCSVLCDLGFVLVVRQTRCVQDALLFHAILAFLVIGRDETQQTRCMCVLLYVGCCCSMISWFCFLCSWCLY